jgi:hypothetical protein
MHGRGRILGIVPRSRRNRLFFLWAVTNVILTFLPVWDVAFNSSTLVGGILPITVLWSYAVFASNLAFAIAYYFGWARKWAADADWEERLVLDREAKSTGTGEEPR